MTLRRSTKKYLESELKSYQDIDNHIKRVEHLIMYPEITEEIPPESQRNFSKEAPFERTSNRILTDKRIQRLIEVKHAINKVYNECSDEDKRLIQVCYFTRPQKLNIEGIIQTLNVSKSQFYRNRDGILERLADELGIIH